MGTLNGLPNADLGAPRGPQERPEAQETNLEPIFEMKWASLDPKGPQQGAHKSAKDAPESPRCPPEEPKMLPREPKRPTRRPS